MVNYSGLEWTLDRLMISQERMSGSRKSVESHPIQGDFQIIIPDYLKPGRPVDGDCALGRHSTGETNEGEPVSVGSILLLGTSIDEM